MQQFTVPQFIDVEDKIFGPITVRQFVIIFIGGAFMYLFFKIFSLLWFAIWGFFDFVTVILFAFYKPNGRPFHYFVLNFVQTLKRPGLRVWKNLPIPIKHFRQETQRAEPKRRSKRNFSNSRLAELSLIVDTQGQFKHSDNPESINLNNKKEKQKDII